MLRFWNSFRPAHTPIHWGAQSSTPHCTPPALDGWMDGWMDGSTMTPPLLDMHDRVSQFISTQFGSSFQFRPVVTVLSRQSTSAASPRPMSCPTHLVIASCIPHPAPPPLPALCIVLYLPHTVHHYLPPRDRKTACTGIAGLKKLQPHQKEKERKNPSVRVLSSRKEGTKEKPKGNGRKENRKEKEKIP